MTDKPDLAARLEADIAALLDEARETMRSAEGNIGLLVWPGAGEPQTAGRANELAESILDAAWDAYELTVRATVLEDVLKGVQGKG